MDLMNAYLAKSLIEARVAAAEARRPGRRIEEERRARRRRLRRASLTRWWQRRAVQGFDLGTLVLALAAPRRLPSVELAQRLDDAAHRIAEHGTSGEGLLLAAMAKVAAAAAPGAAAALVDPEATEVSRQRAYGVVHAHLLTSLGPIEHAWLLGLLDDEGLELPGRAA
jgi:hypothetical protein